RGREQHGADRGAEPAERVERHSDRAATAEPQRADTGAAAPVPPQPGEARAERGEGRGRGRRGRRRGRRGGGRGMPEGGAPAQPTGGEGSGDAAAAGASAAVASGNGSHEGSAPLPERVPHESTPPREYHAEAREPSAPHEPIAHFEPTPKPDTTAAQSKP